MLNQFRSSATSIWAKILLAFLVMSFAVWGIEDMIHGGGRKHSIATVGSKTISSDEFLKALNYEGENIRRVMGEGFSPDMLKNPAISQHVLQQLINQALLRQETEAMGLIPSDADVVRRIRSSAGFQDSKGNFDKGIFESMLRRFNMSEKAYVENLRHEIAVSLLIDTLVVNTPVSDTAARALLETREEGRYVTLYSLKPSLVSNVPLPDDAQIKEYYESHSKDFTAQEYRTLSYMTLTAASVKNAGVSEEDLQALYKERIEDFKHPERRKVDQLLYSSQEEAGKASAMLREGKSFEQVQKETTILNKDSVSLGKVERNSIMENAAEAVFSLSAGSVTEPIQSPFGWHIFRVTAIEPPSVSSLDEVRPVLEKELKQRGSDEALNKLANQLQDALAGGTPLPEAAKEFGLKVMSVGTVDRQGRTLENTKSGDVPDLDKFLEVAFKTDEKSESPLTTAKGGVYYIVRVDKIIPERLRTLDEVKGLVVSGWQKEEREKRLGALAKEIEGKFISPATRGAVIDKYNLQALSTTMIKRGSHTAGDISLPPELVEEVFSRKPQEGTTAHLTKNGDYLAAVLGNIVPAAAPEKDPKMASQLANIKAKLRNTTQNEILHQYVRHLQKKYPVSLNEAGLQAVLK